MNGIIKWFARHPVAANLLMALLVIGGLINLSVISQKVFPEFTLDIITVEVRYNGASPGEIEQSIVQPVEQQLESIEGVTEITAIAAEGVGIVTLELDRSTDVAGALNDVKSEIDRITVFPEEAEEPVVSQASNKVRVAEVAIFGDISERALRELAFEVKDEMVLLDGISLVEVVRAREYEVSIEVSRDALRAYGLTLNDISNAVRRESLELPAGNIDTLDEDVLVRTLGRNLTQSEFEEIIIRSSDQDGAVRLKDIASIDDGFRERSERATFRDKPVVFLQVFRIGDERVLDVVETARTFIDDEIRPILPEGVEAVIWRNDAEELEARLGLLIKNAAIGLFLVLVALTLFLDLRLAFWVAAGIGVSFIAAILVMPFFGLSINQLSMFGFILAIGIVVDDAIVTGENIFDVGEKGTPPAKAAVQGAQRVASPVIFAVATTVAAFTPLLFLPGTLGKFLGDIPAVVIIILCISLVELLLILPRHLSHVDVRNPPDNFVFRRLGWVRAKVDGGLNWFINNPLEKVLNFSTIHWGATIAAAFALLLFAVAIVSGGYVKFVFFPQIEGQYVTATLKLPEGASLQRTERLADEVAAIGEELADTFADEYANGKPVRTTTYILSGAQEGGGGPNGGGALVSGTNQASVLIELLPSEERTFSSAEFEERWREQLERFDGRAQISVDFEPRDARLSDTGRDHFTHRDGARGGNCQSGRGPAVHYRRLRHPQ